MFATLFHNKQIFWQILFCIDNTYKNKTGKRWHSWKSTIFTKNTDKADDWQAKNSTRLYFTTANNKKLTLFKIEVKNASELYIQGKFFGHYYIKKVKQEIV